MERKLLAVVAADMVGFSRLVENNEIEILKRQKKHFIEIIKPTVDKYKGRIIKTTGDGFLATFESSMSAVESSLIIQSKINKLESMFNNDERIWYRFGINIGDVVIDEDDIFGNSVNIASRLESIADPGGISITHDIFKNIKNLEIDEIEYIGDQYLKNISQKIEVYKILVNGNKKNLSSNSNILTESDQEIRYCSSKDNTIIAYAKVGNGPPLLKAPNFMSSLEHDWRSPIWKHMYRFLAEKHTLVRFDQRGNGSSELDPSEISFDSFVDDMEAVVNNTKIEKFPILGVSQGCAVSIAYAIKNPDNVSQNEEVRRTLRQLDLPDRLIPHDGVISYSGSSEVGADVITVGNKIDLLEPNCWSKIKDDGMIPVSCAKGYGLDFLLHRIEGAIMKSTGRKKVIFRDNSSPHESFFLK